MTGRDGRSDANRSGLHRDLAACGVVDRIREDGGIRSVRALLEHGRRELLHALHRADTGADDRADARAVVVVHVETCVLQRELGSDHREDTEAVDALPLLRREELGRVEAGAADPRAVLPRERRAPFLEGLQRLVRVGAGAREGRDAGDDDPVEVGQRRRRVTEARAGPYDARVRAPEGEVVRHRDVDVEGPRLVRHVVEVALRVGLREVRGRRRDLLLDRLDDDDVLDRAGCAEQVADHRLRAADRGLVRMVAEADLRRSGLGRIVLGGARAVAVHVVDVVRLHAGG